jgi:hypothetical protein
LVFNSIEIGAACDSLRAQSEKDETADVGIDLGTPVVETIGADARSRFTGKIHKVIVEVK